MPSNQCVRKIREFLSNIMMELFSFMTLPSKDPLLITPKVMVDREREQTPRDLRYFMNEGPKLGVTQYIKQINITTLTHIHSRR